MIENFYGDGLIDKRIRDEFYPDYDYKGVMIELGAAHPTELSISKHFRENGWRCIGIDANPDFCKMHRDEGNEIYNYACSNQKGKATFYIMDSSPMSFSSLGVRYAGASNLREIEVDVITLNDLLEELKVEAIDFICVDVEGWELEVMQGLDVKKYRPKVVVLENYLGKHEYVEYMKSIGYMLQAASSHNQIFVRES